jgi:hypothetical protein
VIKTRSQRRAAKMRHALVSALIAAAGVAVVVLLALWLGELLS